MPNKNIELEKAIAKYQAAINKHISEGEILWSRYNTMLLFHTLLITAVGYVYQKGANLPSIFTFLLVILGFISCYLWLQMTSRGFQWISYWIKSALKIEKKYLKDECCDERNPVLESNEYKNQIIDWPKTKAGSLLLIKMIMILYFIFFIYLLSEQKVLSQVLQK